MKKITTTLVLLGTLTLGLAVDATIDAQIQAIQSAPAAEKVKLMNEFKQQLMTMNQDQRQEAVAALQTEMQAAGEMTQSRVQERTQARVDQTEATGEMVKSQVMTQKQMGSQVAQEFINSGGVLPSGVTPTSATQTPSSTNTVTQQQTVTIPTR